MSTTAALLLVAAIFAGVFLDKYLLNRGLDLGRIARWVVPIALVAFAAVLVARGYRPGILELVVALICGLVALLVWADLRAIRRGYDLLRRLKYLVALVVGFGIAILGSVTQLSDFSDAQALAASGHSVDAVVAESRTQTSFRRRGPRTRHMHSLRYAHLVWTIELDRPYEVGATIPVVYAESKSSAVVVGGYRAGVWAYFSGDRGPFFNLVSLALPFLGLFAGAYAVRRLLLDERSLDDAERT